MRGETTGRNGTSREQGGLPAAFCFGRLSDLSHLLESWSTFVGCWNSDSDHHDTHLPSQPATSGTAPSALQVILFGRSSQMEGSDFEFGCQCYLSPLLLPLGSLRCTLLTDMRAQPSLMSVHNSPEMDFARRPQDRSALVILAHSRLSHPQASRCPVTRECLPCADRGAWYEAGEVLT